MTSRHSKADCCLLSFMNRRRITRSVGLVQELIYSGALSHHREKTDYLEKYQQQQIYKIGIKLKFWHDHQAKKHT